MPKKQKTGEQGKTLLLDSSAILNDFSFEFTPGVKYFMVPEAVSEIRDLRSRALLENGFAQRALSVREPSAGALEKAQEKARSLGVRLSSADLALVALAIDFREAKERFEAVTDDYSLQNVLKALNLPFSGIIHGEIKAVKNFKEQYEKARKRAENGQKTD
ncbi:MAG: hypothetical protein V1676_01815 [Candidatus Diapherotrites archaeon]